MENNKKMQYKFTLQTSHQQIDHYSDQSQENFNTDEQEQQTQSCQQLQSQRNDHSSDDIFRRYIQKQPSQINHQQQAKNLAQQHTLKRFEQPSITQYSNLLNYMNPTSLVNHHKADPIRQDNSSIDKKEWSVEKSQSKNGQNQNLTQQFQQEQSEPQIFRQLDSIETKSKSQKDKILQDNKALVNEKLPKNTKQLHESPTDRKLYNMTMNCKEVYQSPINQGIDKYPSRARQITIIESLNSNQSQQSGENSQNLQQYQDQNNTVNLGYEIQNFPQQTESQSYSKQSKAYPHESKSALSSSSQSQSQCLQQSQHSLSKHQSSPKQMKLSQLNTLSSKVIRQLQIKYRNRPKPNQKQSQLQKQQLAKKIKDNCSQLDQKYLKSSESQRQQTEANLKNNKNLSDWTKFTKEKLSSNNQKKNNKNFKAQTQKCYDSAVSYSKITQSKKSNEQKHKNEYIKVQQENVNMIQALRIQKVLSISSSQQNPINQQTSYNQTKNQNSTNSNLNVSNTRQIKKLQNNLSPSKHLQQQQQLKSNNKTKNKDLLYPRSPASNLSQAQYNQTSLKTNLYYSQSKGKSLSNCLEKSPSNNSLDKITELQLELNNKINYLQDMIKDLNQIKYHFSKDKFKEDKTNTKSLQNFSFRSENQKQLISTKQFINKRLQQNYQVRLQTNSPSSKANYDKNTVQFSEFSSHKSKPISSKKKIHKIQSSDPFINNKITHKSSLLDQIRILKHKLQALQQQKTQKISKKKIYENQGSNTDPYRLEDKNIPISDRLPIGKIISHNRLPITEKEPNHDYFPSCTAESKSIQRQNNFKSQNIIKSSKHLKLSHLEKTAKFSKEKQFIISQQIIRSKNRGHENPLNIGFSLQDLSKILAKNRPQPHDRQEQLTKKALNIYKKLQDILKIDFGKINEIKIQKYHQFVTFQISPFYQGNHNIIWTYPKTFQTQQSTSLFYCGQWRECKIGSRTQKIKHGHGVQISQQKYFYQGSFCDNLKHGQGIMYHSNGDMYFGEWSDNQMNGKGVYVTFQGDVYQGSFKGNKKHGYGEQKFRNGDSFKGFYRKGLFHGEGKYKWSNGSSYKGDFYKGHLHGRGVWKSKEGDMYQGDYHMDEKHGFGVYRWKNGIIYEGMFRNGKKIEDNPKILSNKKFLN